MVEPLGDAPKGYHAFYDRKKDKPVLNTFGKVVQPDHPILWIRTPEGQKIRARVTTLSANLSGKNLGKYLGKAL